MIREQKLYGGKVLTYVRTAGDSIRRVEAICLEEKAGTYEFMVKDWNELSAPRDWRQEFKEDLGFEADDPVCNTGCLNCANWSEDKSDCKLAKVAGCKFVALAE